MLWLVQRLFYGPESTLAASKPASDLRFGELAILTPLVVLMLVMGLAPNLWLDSIKIGVHPPMLTPQTLDQPVTSAPTRNGPMVSRGLSKPTEIPKEIQQETQREATR